jgi:hypothetical protein
MLEFDPARHRAFLHYWPPAVTFRLKLPGGTLKVKTDNLRQRELKRQVPVWKVGRFHIIWWPDSVPDEPSPKRPAKPG